MNSNPIRTYLVDDEPLARQRMKHLLAKFPDILITGEYGNGTDCIDATIESCPDLIFLDIGLPDHNGLEVVSELAKELQTLPLIVFATAYDKHAIAAFELNAIDYLLKPVNSDRLTLTVERVRNTIASRTGSTEQEKLRNLITSQDSHGESNYLEKIEIKERGVATFIPVGDIHLLQADGNYLEVHTGPGISLWRMTMAKLESQLDPNQFVRVSRSAIVAVKRVVSVEKKGRHEYWVHLNDGARVGASRNLDDLEKRIRNSH